jgi:uncharacterized protein
LLPKETDIEQSTHSLGPRRTRACVNSLCGKTSFDCAKASGTVEELICSDAELAKLDRSLSSLYSTLLKHTPAREQKQLRAEQRGWVKGRNDCWKSGDLRGCVKGEYEMRINELKDR